MLVRGYSREPSDAQRGLTSLQMSGAMVAPLSSTLRHYELRLLNRRGYDDAAIRVLR